MKGGGPVPPVIMIDQNKLIALVLDKNTRKISELQAQVILLESQLELLTAASNDLQEQINKIKKKEAKSDFQN